LADPEELPDPEPPDVPLALLPLATPLDPVPFEAFEPAPLEPLPLEAFEPLPFDPLPLEAFEPVPFEPAPFEALDPVPFEAFDPVPFEAFDPVPFEAFEPVPLEAFVPVPLEAVLLPSPDEPVPVLASWPVEPPLVPREPEAVLKDPFVAPLGAEEVPVDPCVELFEEVLALAEGRPAEPEEVEPWVADELPSVVEIDPPARFPEEHPTPTVTSSATNPTELRMICSPVTSTGPAPPPMAGAPPFR
jgi:hypothetical protein